MAQDPYLDEGMIGWINKTARKEHWRVAWMDLDDLVQEGYFCYCKCKKAYPQFATNAPTKDQRRHFQSLLKTTFSRHIFTLASSQKGAHFVQVSGETPSAESAAWENILPPQPETGSLAVLLAKAPPEILQFLRLLTTDGLDLIAFARRQVGRKQVRETTNEHFCRLLGLDPTTVDLTAQLKSYLKLG